MLDGNGHLASAAACGDEECLLEKLSRACASYCEAGGVFAALIGGDAVGDRYQHAYVRVSEIAIHCDSAKAQAEAGAWVNVPHFLDLAREAAGYVGQGLNSP